MEMDTFYSFTCILRILVYHVMQHCILQSLHTSSLLSVKPKRKFAIFLDLSFDEFQKDIMLVQIRAFVQFYMSHMTNSFVELLKLEVQLHHMQHELSHLINISKELVLLVFQL
jgi:hypothetical protein